MINVSEDLTKYHQPPLKSQCPQVVVHVPQEGQ